jgi:hypothetical protein
MQKGERVQDYFSRVTQFKEQLEAIGDNLDEDELIVTTLNGLTKTLGCLHPNFLCKKRETPICSRRRKSIVITEKSSATLHTMVEKKHQCQQQLVHLQHQNPFKRKKTI